jgi:putative tricarboxylic transport membrane protein
MGRPSGRPSCLRAATPIIGLPMHLSDRFSGGFLVALGAAAAYGGSLLPPVPGQQIGPAVFPMVVGFGLVICGILIMLHVGRSFEDEAEADIAEHGGETIAELAATNWWQRLRPLLPPALIIFYVHAVDRIGFVATGFLIVLTASLAFGARLRLALPLALVAPVLIHLVFYKLLRVPLPAGLIPLPW